MSTDRVQNTHIEELLPDLHQALVDIVNVMNSPERDADLLEKAGLTLERALFPLLVLVERLGPIGIVELADRVGRDYTTVSRQVARLEELGLATRRLSTADKRVREATITPEGKVAADAVDVARRRMVVDMFRDWSRSDFDDLTRLLKMLAATMR
jgi:DNA-binding MarR family transcriptional regulator